MLTNYFNKFDFLVVITFTTASMFFLDPLFASVNDPVNLYIQDTNINFTPISNNLNENTDINKIFQSLDDSRNYFNPALILAKNGNYVDALEFLNRAINLDAKYVEAYIALANI